MLTHFCCYLQDEHRPVINTSAPHLREQAAHMFNTPIDAYYQLSSSAAAKLPPIKSFAKPSSNVDGMDLLLADPNAPGDDLPPLGGSAADALLSNGVFPPSSGVPKLDLEASSLFGVQTKSPVPASATSVTVTAVLDHRPLSQPVYALYGNADAMDGDLSSLSDEQRQEILSSQAEKLTRVRFVFLIIGCFDSGIFYFLFDGRRRKS
jgi:hypothetical protein